MNKRNNLKYNLIRFKQILSNGIFYSLILTVSTFCKCNKDIKYGLVVFLTQSEVSHVMMLACVMVLI